MTVCDDADAMPIHPAVKAEMDAARRSVSPYSPEASSRGGQAAAKRVLPDRIKAAPNPEAVAIRAANKDLRALVLDDPQQVQRISDITGFSQGAVKSGGATTAEKRVINREIQKISEGKSSSPKVEKPLSRRTIRDLESARKPDPASYKPGLLAEPRYDRPEWKITPEDMKRFEATQKARIKKATALEAIRLGPERARLKPIFDAIEDLETVSLDWFQAMVRKRIDPKFDVVEFLRNPRSYSSFRNRPTGKSQPAYPVYKRTVNPKAPNL